MFTEMIQRMLKPPFIPPLFIAVTVLVIIGLINLDLMVSIIARLIPVVVVLGLLGVLLKTLLFRK